MMLLLLLPTTRTDIFSRTLCTLEPFVVTHMGPPGEPRYCNVSAGSCLVASAKGRFESEEQDK